MTETKEVVTAAPRSFAVFLGQVADGDLEREAAKVLYDLVQTLKAEAIPAGGAAKGAITLKLNIEVDIRGQVTVGYDINAKEPTPSRTKSTMWINEDGNVVFEPPRQGKLFPREVGGTKVTLEVTTPSSEAKEI